MPANNEPSSTERYVDPVIEALRRDVDKTLIEKNLRLTHEERLLRLMEMQRFAEDLRRAGRAAKEAGG